MLQFYGFILTLCTPFVWSSFLCFPSHVRLSHCVHLLQTVHPAPLWQEAALHQDQNLSPPEQFLPLCYWPHQQGPGPPLKLTFIHRRKNIMHYINAHNIMRTTSCSFLNVAHFFSTTFKSAQLSTLNTAYSICHMLMLYICYKSVKIVFLNSCNNSPICIWFCYEFFFLCLCMHHLHQSKFLVCVNLLCNKTDSDSDYYIIQHNSIRVHFFISQGMASVFKGFNYWVNTCTYCSGVTVHSIHGAVRTSVWWSRFGTGLVQQEKAKKKSQMHNSRFVVIYFLTVVQVSVEK